MGTTARARSRDRLSVWDGARARLDGLPRGRGLNIAHEAVDRHAADDGARVALLPIPVAGAGVPVTYEELRRRTNRFAHVLTALAGSPGARVASLAAPVPDLHVAVLGTLKARGVFTPLFPAFGPEPVHQRLDLGHVQVLVTTRALFERKVAPVVDRLPELTTVLFIGGGADPDDERQHDLDELLDAAPDDYEIGPTAPDDLALLHFTSGTTGPPKGVMHVHEAVVVHRATAELVLDLHPGDVYWCTADPGWVTGTSYGIVAPLAAGVTAVVDEGEFSAERWYRLIEEHRVTVWYTAPTAVRMLMRAGAELARSFDLSSLRLVASVGEPLHADAVEWGREAFGLPIHDTWWQTETGGIMVANRPGLAVRPGSMGLPVPGIETALLARDGDGEPLLDGAGDPVLVDDPDTPGELLLEAGWPSMFRGYLGQDERYRRAFVGGWYRTGDLARRDRDGYHWFVGRGDDMIKSSGHFIGPFEVEATLLAHPAVTEAGVVGIPDPNAGELVLGFVVLAPGVEDSDAVRRDVLGHCRARLGPAVAPRKLEVVGDILRTRSGKIMRRLLRARYLGLPEGDTSTVVESRGGPP